ncbi:CDP-alcohol phosphatidyltransferase family protein [Nocardioides sp. AE5]|uniref:CDP-alcohol phosphatidyltransferase family protein n=1 Tax=Nocardioides sp. AE5 TaxID=2962573 RepID=UPI0028821109|nr:CDP-alcohol phosphatidyltransferase family protein [Nocardioides sp. AE5]MDT0201044.1 CDP-alcohol phosphatidyltransferase family protein [Nocardioides sp. AE5]
MPKKERAIHADATAERLFTSATVLTFIRTIASLVLCLLAVREESLTLLVVGLATYWIGDTLDGEIARWRDCETRTGAVMDMLCDRINCAAFYIGFAWLEPIMAIPVGIYLFEFMVIDFFLSLAFLAWPIRSPNYFYVVDRRIWLWNWSRPGKALNSGLFAVMLLVTGWWWLGVIIAIALLALKCLSLKWLMDLGLPVPEGRIDAAHGQAPA